MSEWKEPNTKNKSKVVEDFMQMKDTLEVMITNLKKRRKELVDQLEEDEVKDG